MRPIAELRLQIREIAQKPYDTDRRRSNRAEIFSGRMAQITNLVVDEICKLLNMNVDAKVVSLRKRYGTAERFLRPLHTDPLSLRDYFTTINNYRSFDFCTAAMVDCDPVKATKPDGEDAGAKWISFCLYDLATLRPSEGAAPNSSPTNFKQRIEALLDYMAKPPGRQKKRHGRQAKALSANGVCFIAGSTVKRDEAGREPFVDFLALYAERGTSTNVATALKRMRKRSVEIAELCRLLFHGASLLEEQDRREFQLEGLRIAAKLIPIFSRPSLSPATKIAELLRQFEALVGRHLLGGTPGARGKSLAHVHFVNIGYTSLEAGKLADPIFSVYPRVRAKASPIGAFFVSHPKQPSIVKFLLHTFATKNSVELSANFTKLFTDAKGIRRELLALQKSDRVFLDKGRAIRLSKDPYDAEWKFLHQEVSAAGEHLPTQSIVAFVIRGVDGNGVSSNTSAPCGIIAFESKLPDAFSVEDYDFLDQLVRACEPLVQGLKLAQTQTDFRSAISDAFSQRYGNGFGVFRFELNRLDAHLLMQIAESKHDQITTLTELAWETRKAISTRLKPIAVNDRLAEENPDDFLKKRNDWLDEQEEKLREEWQGYDRDLILEFLKHIPSNLVWDAYLSAIPRANAERPFRRDPKLSLLAAGFSALAILVLRNSGETQQIIKLASKSKILKEHSAYRRHVRYRIIHAARIPLNAYAFETSGEFKKGDDTQEGFGALVSDLVGIGNPGRQNPQSLLAKCASILTGIDDDAETDVMDRYFDRDTEIKEARTSTGSGAQRQRKKMRTKVDKSSEASRSNKEATIIQAIEYHFTRNTILWEKWSPEGDEWTQWCSSMHNNTATAVRFLSKVDTYDADDNAIPPSVRLEAAFRAIGDKSEPILIFLDELRAMQISSTGDRTEIQHSIDCRSIQAFIKSIDAIFHFNHDSPFAKVGDLPLSDQRKCIIHGDLSGRNLTWSENSQKFFLIDFENVGVGIWGVDQLKLGSSMIGELMPDLLSTFSLASERRLDAINAMHRNLMDCINYIDKLSDQLDPSRVTTKDLTGPHATFLRKFIHAAFESAEMRRDQANEAPFWRYGLLCFTYKHFEYALRAVATLPEDDVREFVQTISNLVKQTQPTTSAAHSASIAKILHKIQRDAHFGFIAQLIYSFTAFVAAIPSIR